MWEIFIIYIIMAIVSAFLKNAQQKTTSPQPIKPPEMEGEFRVPLDEPPIVPQPVLQSPVIDQDQDYFDRKIKAVHIKKVKKDYSLHWGRQELLQGIIMAEILDQPRSKRPLRVGNK